MMTEKLQVVEKREPEILWSSLAPMLLLVSHMSIDLIVCADVSKVKSLFRSDDDFNDVLNRLPTPPTIASIQAGLHALRSMGAVDEGGNITNMGSLS
jgi:HrpA-like RNA helicase